MGNTQFTYYHFDALHVTMCGFYVSLPKAKDTKCELNNIQITHTNKTVPSPLTKCVVIAESESDDENDRNDDDDVMVWHLDSL